MHQHPLVIVSKSRVRFTHRASINNDQSVIRLLFSVLSTKKAFESVAIKIVIATVQEQEINPAGLLD